MPGQRTFGKPETIAYRRTALDRLDTHKKRKLGANEGHLFPPPHLATLTATHVIQYRQHLGSSGWSCTALEMARETES